MAEMEGGYQMSMNKLLTGWITFICIVGCQMNADKTHVVDDSIKSSETVSFVIDKSSKLNHEQDTSFSLCELESTIVPDTSINRKLYLENQKSLEIFYSLSKPIQLVERIRECPVAIFCNNSKKEYLLAYQYEGNSHNSFSCFEVGYFADDKTISVEKSFVTNETKFQTESGLHLGISFEEVIHIKGKGYDQLTTGAYIVLKYRIDDFEKNSFLKRYNMPGYYMEISLKSNVVKKIMFGFDYP